MNWTDLISKVTRLCKALDMLCDVYHRAIAEKRDITVPEVTEILQMAEYPTEVEIIGGCK